MREFSKDRYGVDVLKVEVPVNMKFVEGVKCFAGQKAYTKKEAIDLFHQAANVATKPFIYLSAGVSNAEFSETLELAVRIWREVQRRVMRARDLERRDSDLCEARCRGFPFVAGDRRGKEH